MTRAHLTLLASLVVAAIAPLASAQTPADSAVKDTTPQKKSRFGGLMNRAKQAANSKAGQAVAKVAENKAVQGAAMGVACTVVPGAAMVSAATGSGPCQNGLMSGLMSGKGLTNAVARLSGNASVAAQVAAIKAMTGGKSGVSGAAAAAAMGAIGGVNGVNGLSAAAQASTMKMILGARVSGTSNAAATASAMKMLQTNGMSNAAAAAAVSGMMQTSGAEQLSGDDAAAALKIITSMNLGLSAGNVAPANGRGAASAVSAAVTTAAPVAALWVNYDFVPGDRVIYYADYTEDQVGNFPQRLQFIEGNMEVAQLGAERMMRATSRSAFVIPLPETLPERFTIEIDVINRPSLDGTDFYLRGKTARQDDAATSLVSWGSDGVSLTGGGGGEVKLSNNEANRLRYRGKPAHLRVLGDGKYIKVYLDEKRLANVPNANFERSKILHMIVDARSEDNPAFIGRIRIAESRKSIYDDLMAAGHVATQGLLFDSGSDQLRPESTPSLKRIASMLQEHPELRIRIEGHTDNVGAKDANKSLSAKRAASVKAALVRDYAISAGRLDSQGFGDSKPLGKNDTSEGRQNNRRVELVKL